MEPAAADKADEAGINVNESIQVEGESDCRGQTSVAGGCCLVDTYCKTSYSFRQLLTDYWQVLLLLLLRSSFSKN